MLNDFYNERWALRKAQRELTVAQRRFFESTAREKVAEGGNQSGKTWAGCVDFLSDAIGDHPTRKWTPPYPGAVWKGWWATTTYGLFAEQAWHHWKKLLLLPDEKLPVRPGQESWFIKGIGWHTKNPEQLAFIKLKRLDGHWAEIYVKAFAQGRGEFQSAEVDRLNLDEECTEDIYDEAQPRVLKRGGLIAITATPVDGVLWLEDLREKAEQNDPDVFHTRFNTLDNPGLSENELAKLVKKYIHRPDIARLRLEGHPVADEGKIYPDTIWTVAEPHKRIVKPFPIPDDWTKYRCSDHGVHVVATLWAAVAPGRKKIAFYREYYGEDLQPSVQANALNVLRLSRADVWAGEPDLGGARVVRKGEDAYHWRGIDKATLGSGQETGTRLIDLWNETGFCSKCESVDPMVGNWRRCAKCGGERVCINVSPATDNRVEAGIEAVKQLLGEKAPDGSPLVVFFDTLTNTFKERRTYGRQPARDKKGSDVGPLRPIKRDDHLMDCLKYLALYGLEWHFAPAPPLPAEGTLARAIIERRQKAGKR